MLFFVGVVVLVFMYHFKGESTQSSATRKRRTRLSPSKHEKGHDDDADIAGIEEGGDADVEVIAADEEGKDDSSTVKAVDIDLGDNSGWKQIGNDVFRAPRSPSLFSAVVGTGWQLLFMMLTLLVLPNLRFGSYFDTGSFISASVILYVIYSVFGGFKSSQALAHFGGVHWIRTVSIQGLLFPLICLCSWTIMCIVHSWNGSILAPGFGFYFVILLIFACLVLPLTFIGTIIQRRYNEPSEDQAQTPSAFPGIIPPKPWYFSNFFLVLVIGLPAFGAICTELYYIATSYSTYWWYYTFGIALIMMVVMIVVVGCTSVIIIFLLLNTEDYRWQWTSFLEVAVLDYIP